MIWQLQTVVKTIPLEVDLASSQWDLAISGWDETWCISIIHFQPDCFYLRNKNIRVLSRNVNFQGHTKWKA